MAASPRQVAVLRRVGAQLLRILGSPFGLLAAIGRTLRRLAASFRFWVLTVVAVLLLLIVYYALSEIYTPLTTDAFVQAYVVQLAPRVAEKVIGANGHRFGRGGRP